MADEETVGKLAEILGEAVTNTIAWIFLVAVATAIVFGVTSWCVLNKFRTFRNFVLLSALVALMLQMLVMWLSDRFISDEVAESNSAVNVIVLCYYVLFQSAFQYWLIVLCYVFSVDFVKVFHYDCRRKYLWSNLFAWAVPFITVHLYAIVGAILYNLPDDESQYIFEAHIAMSLILIPVVLSLITYLVVIGRLIFGASTNKCCGFTIATLIFLFSNVILFTVVPIVLDKDILAVNVIGEILEYLQTIALIVCIVVLKSNWKLWRDHFNKISGPETGVMLGGHRV